MSQPTNYSILLAQRGRGFSEQEVTEILRQVLLQLAQLHRQGQAHDSISLETIWQTENRVAVAAPLQPADALWIRQDLYDLGIVAIALLTAKLPEELRSLPDGTSWDDYCTVSDRVLEILNRLVEISPNRFNSADEVLNALSPSAPPPTVGGIPQNYSIPQSINSSTPNPQPTPWTKIAVGTGILIISGALLIPTALNHINKEKEKIARQNIGAINLGQTAFYSGNKKFSPTVSGLEMGLREDASNMPYKYETNIYDSNRVVTTATPKNDKLKSYLGVVFVSPKGFSRNVCESLEPSSTPPNLPIIVGENSSIECAPGSQSPGAPRQQSEAPAPNSQTALTPIETPSPAIPPEQIVRDYYNNINTRQYRPAWDSLPSDIRNNTELHPQGISSFENWWNTVERVEILQTNLVAQSDLEAAVDVNLQYVMKQGNTTPQSLQFLLIKSSPDRWNIEKVKVN